MNQRVTVSGLQFPTALPQPTPLQTVAAFPNISFSEPVFITHAGDGGNRLFVVEKAGTIRVFANNAAVASSSVFLNISAQVLSDGEQGLLGLAFDPDYATNGFFYVYYSVGSPRRSRISRFQVSAGNANQASPASETILLHVDQPTDFSNHKAGMIAFGPDGKLYIATGDGGSGDDPFNNAQNLNSLLGKILRINTDGSIPSDNPFVGQAGARGEIWAYGLRNPFRMSFDRASGRLWAGDVGQNQREEIDIIVRGGNYGWRIYEGTLSYLNPTNLPASNFVAPVLDYGRGLGVSVTGGYVYRGAALAGFNGAYFYGDFSSGRIWALVHDGSSLISNTEVSSLATNPSGL